MDRLVPIIEIGLDDRIGGRPNDAKLQAKSQHVSI